jgi:pimeloyl-ACP methyl ester carboxylesterase
MIWALGLGLAGLALWPFLAEAMRKPVDALLQADAPGNFVELAGGATHYRWDGPEGGPVVVMIHGLSTPSYVWDAVVPGLTALGFRVLRFDLYGRGFSDRLASRSDSGRYVDQLDGLLEALGVTGRVSLIGFSMGARIAVDFAAKDADRVEHLCLVAPAGLAQLISPADRVARDWPGFGDWYCRALGVYRQRKTIDAQSQGSHIDGIAARLLAETKLRGYAPAILADLRDVLRDTDVAEHGVVHRASVPMAALFGARDLVVPVISAEHLGDWNPDATIEIVEGAGHSLPHTHPDAVVDAFARLSDDFL